VSENSSIAPKLQGTFSVFSFLWNEDTGEERWLATFAWEQPGDRLVGVECRMPRFTCRRFRCPLKAHHWAYLFALRLWREHGKPAERTA
jgi:hypothetical protein